MKRDYNWERMNMMAEKLQDQIDRGCINNPFCEDFVPSVAARLNAGIPLTQKQQDTLENLFERY